MTTFTVTARRGAYTAFSVSTFPDIETATIYTDVPVMFSVDAGGPFADTSLLTGLGFVGDISHEWAFDDDGATFQFDTPFGDDANYGYGLTNTKAWSTAGTYDVTLNSKSLEGEQTQTIAVTVTARPTPDKLYAVSFDGIFTDAPAGATQISTWSQFIALSDTFRSDSHVELYFRRGEVFDIESQFIMRRPSGGTLHVLLDAFGTGDNPILRAANSTVTADYAFFNLVENVQIVCKVDMDGNYNSKTGALAGGFAKGLKSVGSSSYLALVGCECSGMALPVSGEGGASTALYDVKTGGGAAYSAVFNNGGDGASGAWVGVKGCEIYHLPDALRLQDDISGGANPDATQGAHIRTKAVHRVCIDNARISGTVGFSAFGGVNADAATQPAFRVYRDGCAEGHLFSITRIETTGRFGGVTTQYPLVEPMDGAGRYLIDRIRHTEAGTNFHAGGVMVSPGGVVQNVSTYIPNVHMTGGGSPDVAPIILSDETGNSAGLLTQPILARAITLVSDRSVASGGLDTVVNVNNDNTWTGIDITTADIVLHAPNHTDGSDFAPFSRGDYFAPVAGSSFGTATNPPVFDIDGATRTGTSLKGAHHALKSNVAVSNVSHSGDAPTIAKLANWPDSVYALTDFGTGYSNADFYLVENGWADADGAFGSNAGRTWAIDTDRMGEPSTSLQNTIVFTNKSGVRVSVASNSVSV